MRGVSSQRVLVGVLYVPQRQSVRRLMARLGNIGLDCAISVLTTTRFWT